MPKGVANKRYTPEFKKLEIETMEVCLLYTSDAAERRWVKRRRARVEEMRLVNGGAMWASSPTQTEGIFF